MRNSSYSQSDDNYVDLSITTLVRRIRKRRYWLLATVSIGAILSIAYAFLATPIYQSSILVAPAGSAPSGGSALARIAQSFGGGGLLGGSNVSQRNNQAIALSSLTSPFFIRAFIEENDLLPVLFASDWDAEKGEWNVAKEADIPTLSDGYDLFESDILSVEEEDRTNLVTVTIDWDDPVLAAEWANKLVDRVNSRLRGQAIGDADLTIDYLNEELAKTQAVELQQAIYFLVEGEIQKKTMAKVQKEYAYRVLSPAIPSDLDKYASPNRAFIISVGISLGLFFGLIAVSVAGSLTDNEEN